MRFKKLGGTMVKFVTDSSCDLLSIPDVSFVSAPLTIRTDKEQWIDDENIDIHHMLNTLASYKGRSYTSCPSIEDWMKVYEGGDIVYAATLTSALSGTYNAAMAAAHQYQAAHPEVKIHVFDTLSTGPELHLLMEKLMELNEKGLSFEEVCVQAQDYLQHTRLFFSLQSVHNLAQNGRINKTIAAAIGLLGIRIFGTASEKGELEPLAKCRGDKKVISEFIGQLRKHGFSGGKLRISHVENPELADTLANQLKKLWPQADILTYPARGLCSYYAERGGILLGAEFN